MWNNHGAHNWRSPPPNFNAPGSSEPHFLPDMSSHAPTAPGDSFCPERFGRPRLYFPPRPPPNPALPRSPSWVPLHRSPRVPPPPPPFLRHASANLSPCMGAPPGPESATPFSMMRTQSSVQALRSAPSNIVPNLDPQEDRTRDSIWVQSWMDNIGAQRHRKDELQIKISEIQNILLSYTEKLLALTNAHKEMSDLKKINDQDWDAMYQSVENTKRELKPLRKLLEDPAYAARVKAALDYRRGKRRRARLSRSKRRARREQRKVCSEEEEKKIDSWRKQLTDEEASKNQVERMMKEADSILGEVRGKQEETSKLQQLLSALHKLRKARLTKGHAHGFFTTPTADEYFTKITGELQKMLETQNGQYKLEEQTLKVLMEESPNVLFDKSSLLERGKNEDLDQRMKEIRRIYFGAEDFAAHSQEGRQFHQSFVAAEESLEILLQRRTEWDQFLLEWESPLSSGIPLSYVVPPSAPEGLWKNYQNSTNL